MIWDRYTLRNYIRFLRVHVSSAHGRMQHAHAAQGAEKHPVTMFVKSPRETVRGAAILHVLESTL
jgi:predicted ribosome quality control (RQC) complex YloA/Tae2 family protein